MCGGCSGCSNDNRLYRQPELVWINYIQLILRLWEVVEQTVEFYCSYTSGVLLTNLSSYKYGFDYVPPRTIPGTSGPSVSASFLPIYVDL